MPRKPRRASAPTRRWAPKPRSSTSASSMAAAGARTSPGIIKMIDDSWKVPQELGETMRIAFVAACLCVCWRLRRSETSQANNAQANISKIRATEPGDASNLEARVSLGDAPRSCTRGTRAWKRSARTSKPSTASSTPAPRTSRTSARPPRQIAELSRKASGWFPDGTGPERRQDWSQAGNLAAAEQGGFRRQARVIPACRAGVQRDDARGMTWTR